MIMVHKMISQHSVKPITHFSFTHFTYFTHFFLLLSLSVDFHMLRPGVRFTDRCGLGGICILSNKLSCVIPCVIINNNLALPLLCILYASCVSKMKLQKDEVVVECSEQIPTCSTKEKNLRDTQPGWNKLVNMAADKTFWYSAASSRLGLEVLLLILALGFRVRGLRLVGNRLTQGNRLRWLESNGVEANRHISVAGMLAVAWSHSYPCAPRCLQVVQ